MRNCLFLILFVLLLGTPGIVHSSSPSTPLLVPDAEEYDVYSSLLGSMINGKDTKQFVIEKYTAVEGFSGANSGRLIEQLSPLTIETIDDFKSRNGQPAELSDKFGLKVKINLLSKEEMEQIFERRGEKYDGWKAFREKYPNAGSIITLSRVGFNTDRSQALVYMGFQCGWLCGEGNYILLAKTNGEWKSVKRSMAWIS